MYHRKPCGRILTPQHERVVLIALAATFFLAGASAADWPTYMHDAGRGGVTTERLALPMGRSWTFVPRHAPQPAWPDPGKEPVKLCFDQAFQVVVADGALYFASSADHKVYCLDAATGETRWATFTGGPIRIAPSVWQGRVYVGSDDGCAYCLSAADGKILWKVRGAPSDRRVLGNGKMISPWPVRTGVLVVKGTAYFFAGLFPSEGVFVYALDAATGEVKWRNDTSGQIYRKMPHPGAEAFSGVPPQGALLASATRLYVPTGRNVPAAFDLATGRLVQYEPEAKYSIGGTYALVADDLIVNGPTGLVAYKGQSGDVFASFPGRRILVTQDTTYLLSGTELLAADRNAYTDLRAQHKVLEQKRAKVSRDRSYWGRRLRALQKKLEGGRTPELEEIQKRFDALYQQYRELTAAMNKLNPPIAACVKWRQQCNCPDALVMAGDVLLAAGKESAIAVDAATGKPLWQGHFEGKALGLAVAEGRLYVSTDTGAIHCFAPSAQAPKPARTIPQPVASVPAPRGITADAYRAAAQAIVKQTGIARGYCLVLNCGEGGLMLELAKSTQLRLVGIEPDARKVAAAKRALDAAGLYGVRAVVDQGSASRLPYSDYFANLIVCDEVIPSGVPPVAAKELLRVLKPCGGIAYIGRPAAAAQLGQPLTAAKLKQWAAASGDSGWQVTQEQGVWAKLSRGPLPGAGEWTHHYANPGNTVCSTDQIVKCPLGVLWFGDPGPAKLVNRHSKAPAPVCTDGRLFISGRDVIIAVDAYNGYPLWEQSLQGARRVGTHTETSNLVAAKDSVYVSLGDHCLRLDAATGANLGKWPVPPAAATGQPRRWGYLAVWQDMLLGSAAFEFTAAFLDEEAIRALRKKNVPWPVLQEKLVQLSGRCFRTRDDLERGLAGVLTPQELTRYRPALLDDGGLPLGGMLSDAVFALDRRTGKTLWVHRVANGYVHHVAIAIAGGRMFLAETDEKNPAPRRVIALDAASGRPVWERSVDVAGCGGSGPGVIAAGKVVLLAAPAGGRRLIALSAHDGSALWDERIRFTRHLVVTGNTIYGEPFAYDLATGKTRTRTHPLTGEPVPWQFSRAYGCGAVSAAPSCLFFRSGTFGFYDLKADEGTSNWGGIRPGCWINIIAAAGLVLAPEGSSGCTCSYPIQASLALAPTRRNENWSAYSTPGATRPVRHIAINLGAPGDRRSPRGVLWLSYPRPPRSQTLKLDMRNEFFPGLGYFHHNADVLKLEGTDKPWVFTSGACGLKRATLKLMDKGPEPARYTVRLCFAELTPTRLGQRVFDIRLQGQTVAKDFDVLKAADGTHRALVKEFRGISVADSLVIELVPRAEQPTLEQAPVLCGIEAVREGT